MGQRKINNVPRSVLVWNPHGGISVRSCPDACCPKLFSILCAHSQPRKKYAGLMTSTRVPSAQTIVP